MLFKKYLVFLFPCIGLLHIKHFCFYFTEGNMTEPVQSQQRSFLEKPGRCIPTLNNKGFQMASPSPLLEDWVESYDGRNPLLDIGCAYGINTYEALEHEIPVIALDMDREHLKIVHKNVSPSKLHLLSCLVGSLPYAIPLPDSSVSGILLAECAHFLDAKEITAALRVLLRKLVPGGRLCITTMSIHYLDDIDPSAVQDFYANLNKGVRWPGVLPFTSDYWKKLTDSSNCSRERFDTAAAKPSFTHFTVLEQLAKELRNVGFEIERIVECKHAGYPTAVRENCRANIQVICRKPA